MPPRGESPRSKKNVDRRTQELAALATKLGADLANARGDDARIRAIFDAAVLSFMAIERAAGAAEEVTPAELQCAEVLRDGSGDDIPSAFELANADDDECADWGDLLADAAGY